MMKTILLASTLALGSATLPVAAGAWPIDHGLRATSGSVILVREACGPGRQYSEALRSCVADTGASRRRDVRQDVGRCGAGLKWSDRVRACVPI